GFAGGGFAYLMSSERLASVDDFSGQKLWTPEGDEIAFAALKSLGIAPVMMPTTDVLTGLQTDLLDSVAVPPVAAVVFQWHTRLKFILELPVAYVYGALLIERRAFDRMSEADRAVVREVFESFYTDFDATGAGENLEALEALLDSGLQLVQPDSRDVQDWKQRVNASHAEQAARGLLDEELLKELQALLEDYRTKGTGG
ncbi:MAG: TRAP transporter substrate-binding protein DctP, partial [Xanthomonadales bacterium]|nr:TRAP transporter substrate-binding protein DctP [Xanthomonadales bacterium]